MMESRTAIGASDVPLEGTDQTVRPGKLRWYPERPIMVFLVFLAFVVARYIQIGARRDILATVRFEFLLGIMVLILVIMEFGTRKPEIGRSQSLFALIALLFFAMIVQIPFAAAPVVARTIFWDRVIKFALLTFFMVVFLESPRYLKWFLAAFIFSVFYITQESVRGLISGGLIWENQGVMRLHGAVPIYAHPNSLSGVAMGSVPYVVFLWGHIKSKLVRLGLLATLGTSLTCVLYSGSRTAYIGFFSLLLWWWLYSKKKWKFLIYFLGISAIVLSVIPEQYIERFQSIGGQEKEGRSKDARIRVMTDAWIILNENPLGVGVASFPYVRMAKFGKNADTHNLYLEVATNLGYQGLAVFLALVGVLLNRLRVVGKEFQEQNERLRALARSQTMSRDLKREIRQHYQDLDYFTAVARATGGFIFIRLVLGFFGMDLYEIYWWFGSGLAITLSALVVRTNIITGKLIRTALKEAPPEPGLS